MPSPYEQTGFIGGALPPTSAPGGITGSPADIQSGYNSAYNSASAINSANYNNIMAGYQQTAAGQRSAQDAIAAGYPQLAGRIQGQLGQVSDQLGAAGQQTAAGYGGVSGNYLTQAGAAYNAYGSSLAPEQDALGHMVGRNADIIGGYGGLQQGVFGDIANAGREQSQQIQDEYRRGSANAYQSAVGRGLGNTTVQDSLQRGVEFDRARSQNDLAERLGNLRAGYRSQLGQADLGFQERAVGAETGQQNVLSAGLQRGTDIRLQMAGQAAGIGQAGLQAGERFAGQQAGIGQAAAGYGAQIGQAGLGYQGQAASNNTNLALSQLGFMNSVNAPYPNASAYQQAAQMSGAADAARQAQRSMIGMPPGGASSFGGMQMVPGTGRGVPSSPLSLQPGGYPDGGGGGYFGQAQLGPATTGGVAPSPTIMSTGQMQLTGGGGYSPQGTTAGVGGLTGGTFGGSNRLGGSGAQPAPTGSGGGYNPSGFGGGLGGYGGNNAPVDEYGFTEADWQSMYADPNYAFDIGG